MRYWRETWAVAQRILTELWHRKRSLIFWCIFPVAILLLNGYILAERAQIDIAEAMKFAAPPSLVGAALFFSCLGGSVATVVAEREQETLKRLFISPLSGVSYFFGIFFAHSVIALMQTVLVYTLARVMGAKVAGSIFLGLVIIVLSIITYVGVGFILGTQLARRTEDVNALVATFGVPLLILGGTFLPVSLFPENLIKVAEFNPIYHMNEALSAIWANGADFAEIKPHFGFLVIFALLMFLQGWFAYQKMLLAEKRL